MIGIFEFKATFDNEHLSAHPGALRCNCQTRGATPDNHEVRRHNRIVVEF